MSGDPLVSLLIVNWNAKELLSACLRSLEKQTFTDFETIVIDNGSCDGSADLIRRQFPHVRLIEIGKNLGFSTANNIGIRKARGKYIALLNNDTEVDPGWLEELVNVLETRSDIGFCASKMLLFDQHHLADTCGDYYSVDGLGGKIGHLQPADLYNEPREVFAACAGAAIYRRDLLDELGGFDEDFFLAHEDTDLSFRAQLKGYRCLYVPTAIVYHHLSASIGAGSNTYIYYGHRNAEFVYLKNMPASLLWRSFPSHLLLNAALLLFYLYRKQAWPFLRAKWDAIKSLPAMLRKRRDIQEQRVVSDEYIASILDESWLIQAVRKRFRRWWDRLREALHTWGRRTLPYSWKRQIKRIIPIGTPAPQVRIPITPESVENALRPWTEHQVLRTAVKRAASFNAGTPRASIIVATYNKLPYTRLCIESLYRNTEQPSFELIVVDNGSEDNTTTYLKGLVEFLPNLRVILNSRNEGFARANNQGILKARGEYVVLLNNDTIVTRSWLSRLIQYLEQDPKIGMVGPVTNSGGNEQMILAQYSSLEELETFAERRAATYQGHSIEIEMLTMFCIVMRRPLIDQIGLLDEQFELGMFEDDDYAHRVRLQGYKLVCVEDVFVHHFGSATMGGFGERAYLEIFERNRRRFEQKWGVRWRPQRLRLRQQ